MAHRLTITPSAKPAISVDRRAVKNKKVVYVICTPKSQMYLIGRSRIIYIGTTETGVHRVASSMAHKAIDFLKEWGVRRLDVFLVTCPPRGGVQSWRRLECDLLIAFKLEHGRVPLANKSGKNFTPDRLSGLFQYRRLVKVLACYR